MTLDFVKAKLGAHAYAEERLHGDAVTRGQADEDGMTRHKQRAEAAHAGLLLHGPEEYRDANYVFEHQDLINGAYEHKLVTDKPIKPVKPATVKV